MSSEIFSALDEACKLKFALNLFQIIFKNLNNFKVIKTFKVFNFFMVLLTLSVLFLPEIRRDSYGLQLFLIFRIHIIE